MFTKAIFLLLPVIAQAEIRVMINAGIDKDVHIGYIGANVDIISDNERHTFDIGDERLKDAAKIYSGGRPDDVFVRSPTPWNDLYATYNWSQVTRTVKPVKSRILNIRSEPAIVYSQEFINNSSHKAVYDPSITEFVSDIFDGMWYVHHELDVSQEIDYAIQMNVNYSTKLSFKSKWGEDVVKVRPYTIGTKNATKIVVEPQQKVISDLTAIRESIDIEVIYKATLKGFVACNYSNRYEGHHFWAYNINALLDAAKMPKEKKYKKVINIIFYHNAKVVVTDAANSQPIREVDAEVF